MRRIAIIAEPICQVIAPHTYPLSVAPYHVNSPSGSQWEVTCGTLENGEPAETAYLTINPQTNATWSITIQPTGKEFVRSSKDLSGLSERELQAELTTAGRRWLLRFGFAETETWQFVSAEWVNDAFCSYWRANQKSVFVVMDRKDGGLRLLTFNPVRKRKTLNHR